MLCSGVKTGGTLNNPAAGPIAIGDNGRPIAINGISVPEIYDAFVRPSIVAIALEALATGYVICLVNASPKKTVMPTGVRKKVTEPKILPNAEDAVSFFVRILNGLGTPFSLSDCFKVISLSPKRGSLFRYSLFKSLNSVNAIGPMVIPRKKETKTVTSGGTTSSPQYK